MSDIPWHMCSKCLTAIPPDEPWFYSGDDYGFVLCLFCKLSDKALPDDEVKELYKAEMARLKK